MGLALLSGNAEAALNQQAKEIASKALASARLQKAELKKKQTELTAKQQVRILSLIHI